MLAPCAPGGVKACPAPYRVTYFVLCPAPYLAPCPAPYRVTYFVLCPAPYLAPCPTLSGTASSTRSMSSTLTLLLTHFLHLCALAPCQTLSGTTSSTRSMSSILTLLITHFFCTFVPLQSCIHGSLSIRNF